MEEEVKRTLCQPNSINCEIRSKQKDNVPNHFFLIQSQSIRLNYEAQNERSTNFRHISCKFKPTMTAESAHIFPPTGPMKAIRP